MSNMQVSEIFDRISILRLKSERLPDVEEANAAQKQMMELIAGWDPIVMAELETGKVEMWSPSGALGKLYDVNRRIWDTETSIRSLARNPDEMTVLDLAALGRLAIKVRDLNRERCWVKNQICDIFGGYKECKVNYGAPVNDHKYITT